MDSLVSEDLGRKVNETLRQIKNDMALNPEGGTASPGKTVDPKNAPTPEKSWGINGHQNDNFDNHRENAASNATHAGILASQTQVPVNLPKPNMLTAPGSANFVRPN